MRFAVGSQKKVRCTGPERMILRDHVSTRQRDRQRRQDHHVTVGGSCRQHVCGWMPPIGLSIPLEGEASLTNGPLR